MLVSDLIKLRNDLLAKIELMDIDHSVKNSYNVLNSVVTENPSVEPFVAHEKIIHYLAEYDKVHQRTIELKSALATVQYDIEQAIDSLASNLLYKPNDLPYQNYHKFDFKIDPLVDQSIRSHIHRHADFHFPGMQLGCANIHHTNELVANDPLYLCDFNISQVDTAANQFNDIYNRRIRRYQIVDHKMDVLPQNQFGFILCWMMFNYTGLDIIRLYLENIIKLLRPGGSLMFSYNNGDLLDSCKLAELNGMSYVPKHKLVTVCTDIGYEIVDVVDMDNCDHDVKHISWLEIRKPGNLSTVKLTQAAGQILTK